jgi:hypothetical protein
MDYNRLEKRMADTLIDKVQDKTGAEVLIKLTDSIGGSPIVPFYLRHYSELIANGHAHPVIVGTNRHRAIYVEIDGEIAGHIVFEVLEDPYKTAWITFSVVEKIVFLLEWKHAVHKFFVI